MSPHTGTDVATPIPFIDLAAQRQRLGRRIDDAIMRVVDHGVFIMGPEVRQIEADLAAFCEARHVVSCASGTDALALVLMAKGVKAGDGETFNMDPASLEAAIETTVRGGLKPVAVIAVDLFGQPADYEAIEAICARHQLWLLADAAQSFGATYRRRRVGTIGTATSTSFFPAKPLGCYGDGGAVFTDDDALAAVLRSLRVHGQGADKYDNVRIGMNGRLDTVQAAVLLEKLKIFPEEIAARQAAASRYTAALADVAGVPRVLDGASSVWAQYTLRVAGGRREALAARLKAEAIPTAIYYPRPLHRQTAYRDFPVAGGELPVSDRLAAEVISLPMHPYLSADVQDRIIDAVRRALASI
jgi:dTDP-4-amino-4,6-dideoxygalactose transaminase